METTTTKIPETEKERTIRNLKAALERQKHISSRFNASDEEATEINEKINEIKAEIKSLEKSKD